MKLVKIISIVCAATSVALSASCGSASVPEEAPTTPVYVNPGK